MKEFVKVVLFVVGTIIGSIGFMMTIVGGLGNIAIIMGSGVFAMVFGLMCMVKGME